MSLEYRTNNVGLTGIRTKISALSLLTVKLYFSLNSRGQADHEALAQLLVDLTWFHLVFLFSHKSSW